MPLGNRQWPFSKLTGHSDTLTSAAFFADGRRVVTASADHTARVWDAETGRELLSLPHAGPVSHVAVAPDGCCILTVSKNQGAVIWTATQWDGSTPRLR